MLQSGPAWAQQGKPDLSEMSIEQLLQVRVTSVAKKEQSLVDTAAAVYVITSEEIRRSGMTSIPELLRLAPGINVAQIDANMWAITSRGFNSEFANKLLVLIDGRSVYNPLYSGVYWDAQDLLLEDIDRIEVIRGPGAALWGANAVNGVINIITKRAQDTQGILVSNGISTTEQRFVGVRYGGKAAGREAYWRLFAKYFKRDGLIYDTGIRSADGWDVWRGGFRSDIRLSERDSLAVEGDIYNGTVGQHVNLVGLTPLLYSTNEQAGTAGADLLARWQRIVSPRSDLSLIAYVDTTRRDELLLGQRVTTFDLEFQHHRLLGKRHELVWGLSYRRVSDETRGSNTGRFIPTGEGTNLFSGFVQDEIALLNRRLRLTLGTKLEHNDYTGVEVQPSARLWFAINPRHHVWAAVSRAVRTPSRSEREIRANLASQQLPNGGLMLVSLLGNPNMVSEDLLAYEAGYRWQAGSRLAVDLASFYNIYHDFASATAEAPVLETSPWPPHLLVPLTTGNLAHAVGYGAEAALNLQLARFWMLSTGYSWLRTNVRTPVGPTSVFAQQFTGEAPQQSFSVRSSFTFSHNLEADVAAFYVGSLVQQQIPAYTRLDARLGWRPTRQLELSVGGQNLLQAQHPEYRYVYVVTPTEIRRNAYVKVTWRF